MSSENNVTEHAHAVPRDPEPAGVAAIEAIARIIAELPGSRARLTLSGEDRRAAFDLLARLPAATILVTVYPEVYRIESDNTPFVIFHASVRVSGLEVEAQWSRTATPGEAAFLREGGGKTRRIGEYSALAWAERRESTPEIS